MAKQLIGKWQEQDADNMENFLKAMDVNVPISKITGGQKSCVEISEDGGVWTIKSHINGRDTTITFKLGETFEETDAAGRKGTSTFKLEGDKLVKEQVMGSLKHKSIREVKDGMLVITMIAPGDVTATIRFKAA